MNDYTVNISDQDGAEIAFNERLTMTPQRWSDAMPGGPKAATVDVTGPVEAVRETINWLRYHVSIQNKNNTVVWFGFINAIDLSVGPATYLVGVDDIANRVQVFYSYDDVDGKPTTATTDWSVDSASVDRYGYKELRYGASIENSAKADALVAQILDQRSRPLASVDIGQNEVSARLHCVGWWQTLGWRYYANVVGREEYVGSGNSEKSLGLGFTTSDIGFTTDRDIYEHDCKFTNFSAGEKIKIVGSTLDATYTIASGNTADEQDTITNRHIYFEPNDDIKGRAGYGVDLVFIRSGEYLDVAESPLNSGYHLMTSATTLHATTKESVTGNIVYEDSDLFDIVLTQGGSIGVDESIASYEIPGVSSGVTVTAYGEKVAQYFINNTGEAFTVDRIGLRVRHVGDPTDNLTVELCANDGGIPGTVLDTGTILATDIGSSMQWEWAEMSNTQSLTLATTFFIVVSRVGANDPDNFYKIGVNEDADHPDSALQLYDGVFWQNDTTADMMFRVWGSTETTAQLQEVMESAGQFITASEVRTDSGIETNQFRDGLKSGLEEVVELLDTGTSTGAALTATMTPERAVVFDVVPDSSTADIVIDFDGMMHWRYGGAIEEGRTVAGHWVQVENPPGGAQGVAASTPIYVASSEFDAGSGHLGIRPASAPDPFDLSQIVQG